MSSDLITYYLLERRAVCKPANIDITMQREETNAGTNTNDSFGKRFNVHKDHVPNRLMTGRCPSKSLQLRPKTAPSPKSKSDTQSDRQSDYL